MGGEREGRRGGMRRGEEGGGEESGEERRGEGEGGMVVRRGPPSLHIDTVVSGYRWRR